MPPEEKKEDQTQQTQETQGTQETQQTLEAMRAELDEERKVRAAFETALADKDKRITELQAEGAALRAEQSNLVTQAAELTQVKEAHTKAVTKCLDMARALNPTIPGDVITGTTIDEIDASVAKAKSIAESVKKVLEAQAK